MMLTLPLLTTQKPGGRINIKMSSYQYRKSHCGDKTILRPSYLHKNLRPAAVPMAVAYEPVQKHKVTPGIPGWLNKSLVHSHISAMCHMMTVYILWNKWPSISAALCSSLSSLFLPLSHLTSLKPPLGTVYPPSTKVSCTICSYGSHPSETIKLQSMFMASFPVTLPKLKSNISIHISLTLPQCIS